MRVVNTKILAGVPRSCGISKDSIATTNERMPDASSAGSSSGKLMRHTVRQALAPAMRAASSSVASIANRAGWTNRNSTGAERAAPSTIRPP